VSLYLFCQFAILSSLHSILTIHYTITPKSIPLNCIVVVSLLLDPRPTVSFVLNSVMLAVACLLQVVLAKQRAGRNEASDRSTTAPVDLIEATPLVGSGDSSAEKSGEVV
jgi:hypothetical protein